MRFVTPSGKLVLASFEAHHLSTIRPPWQVAELQALRVVTSTTPVEDLVSVNHSEMN